MTEKNAGLSKLNSVEIDWLPDRSSETPVYRQIVRYIAERISRGDWIEGDRLPSQRRLAEQFGVNRSTIVTAMEELTAYGILTSGHGGGTRVSGGSWSLLLTQPPDWNKYIQEGHFRANKPTIQMINQKEYEEGYVRIGTGELAPELYPKALFTEILTHLPNRIPSLNYLEGLGLLQLRKSLGEYLLRTQGIRANPDQILITTGSLQALQLVSICMLKRVPVHKAREQSLPAV